MEYATISDWHKNSDDIVYVSGEDALHPDVLVQTTDTAIRNCIDKAKDGALIVFPQVWKALKSADADVLYAAGGQPWQDFMDDIIVFYACRLQLFGKPIPIIKMEPVFDGIVKKIDSERGIVDTRAQAQVPP
jgi:hypothetical protein